MALVITVKEGESFFVGDNEVKVTKIIDPQQFKIQSQRDGMTEIKTIRGDMQTEIYPEVMCQAGTNSDINQVRVALTAPKNIKILREELYREAQEA